MRNPYMWLGFGLTLLGASLSPVFYFILDSAPLTAVGISLVMLGLTAVALANSRPPISPEASQMMLRTGMENTAALLEELGLSARALYLPSSMREGRPQALIPLRQSQNPTRISEKIPGRLIVRYGRDPHDVGIVVTTPGSICLDGLEAKPGPTSSELEAALSHILVGMLDIAGSVSVNSVDNRVRIEISHPRLSYENIWFYRSLGSPLASIAATIASEAFDKPVIVVNEENSRGKGLIELEVLS